MATYDIQISSTSYPLLFMLVRSVDHITALNSATPTVVISKTGTAGTSMSFAAVAGTVVEVGRGWYMVKGNATDTNALGPLALNATAGTSSDPTDTVYNVVGYNPQVTNLAANVSQWLGVAPAALVGGLVQTTVSGNIAGNVTGSVASVVSGVNVTQWQAVSPAPLVSTLVQTQQSGNIAGSVAAVTSGVNVTQWLGALPAPLITGLVQTQTSGPVSSVTGSVASVTSGVNVTQIAGAVVNTASAQIGASVISYASGQSPAVQVWDTAAPIETGISPRRALLYIAAAEAGVTTSNSPTNFVIAAISNSGTTRITAVTDASGNRTSVSLT